MSTRRQLLGGASALVIMANAGLLGIGPALADATDAEIEARGYNALLAGIREDYLAGRVGLFDRWVLSEHELERLAARDAVG